MIERKPKQMRKRDPLVYQSRCKCGKCDLCHRRLVLAEDKRALRRFRRK